jgi:hypothetical protein
MSHPRVETKAIIGAVAAGFLGIVLIARLTNDPSARAPRPPVDAGPEAAAVAGGDGGAAPSTSSSAAP